MEESKKRYEEKEVWHGPFLGSAVTHYNEEIISGDKYSVAAYSRNGENLRGIVGENLQDMRRNKVD